MTTLSDAIACAKARAEEKKPVAVKAVDIPEDVDSGIAKPTIDFEGAIQALDRAGRESKVALVAYYAAFAECGFRYQIRPQANVYNMLVDFLTLLMGQKNTLNGTPIVPKDGERKAAEFCGGLIKWIDILSTLADTGVWQPPVSDEERAISLFLEDPRTAGERCKALGFSASLINQACAKALQRLYAGKK